jgi:hypothetical protein
LIPPNEFCGQQDQVFVNPRGFQFCDGKISMYAVKSMDFPFPKNQAAGSSGGLASSLGASFSWRGILGGFKHQK